MVSESKNAEASEQPMILMQAMDPNGNAQKTGNDKGERFCMLSEIDRNSEKYKRTFYENGVTLESFCQDFRNYAANKLKLYYDIEDIRRFVSGLAVSKLVILQGMSGTGKTSLAHAFGSFTDNSSTVIPVQPMWKERTDLIGYYNEFTKRFNETLLLEKMYEANYSADMYITVLDEMNIARVEYYFAEFLSLLELPNPDDKQALHRVQKSPLPLPLRVWIPVLPLREERKSVYTARGQKRILKSYGAAPEKLRC